MLTPANPDAENTVLGTIMESEEEANLALNPQLDPQFPGLNLGGAPAGGGCGVSGFPLILIPIPKGRKGPVLKNWQTLSPEPLAELIAKNPGCNRGIRHDNTAVLDPDSKEAGERCDSWETQGKLPKTVKWITAAGNTKRLYKRPIDLAGPLTIKELKLQLRTGAGLQDVIPPSYVKDPEKGIDGCYKWVEGCDPASVEVAELPREILNYFKTHSGNGNGTGAGHRQEVGGDYEKYAQTALADELKKLAGTSEGNRNDQLNSSSFSLGQLVGAGVLERVSVEAALQGVAASIGLTGGEIRATIHSGIEAGMRQPRQLPEKQSKSRKQKREQKKTVPPLIKNLDIASIYAQETGLKLLTNPPQVDEAGFTPCSVLYCPEDPGHTAFVNIGQGERRGYYIEMKDGHPWGGGNLSKVIAANGSGPYMTPKEVYRYLEQKWGQPVGGQTHPGVEKNTTKPIISITDRFLDSISNSAIKALENSNNPPFIFIRAGSLARVSLDEKRSPKIQMLNETQLRGVLARNALFMRETENGPKPTSPPKDVAKDILHLGGWPFPALEGIVQSPVMRPDGTILVEPGYDPVTHLYYVKPANLSMPEIPVNPSFSDIEGYLGYILEAIRDFPFAEDADRANALGLIMTLPLRPAIVGNVPMAVITAPAPGTGKSLLTDVVALVGTGQLAPMTGFPGNDEEMRKAITSFLMEGAPIIPFDNIETPLWGPSLSRAITCTTWKDRILGGNTTAHLPQKAVWLSNGNNVRLRGDLPRRTFPIRLDARLGKPWERENFRHKNLREWVLKWRGGLLVSIHTIARAWFVAGKPEPQRPVPVMGGFEEWANTIGGILAFAGVEGFLENLAQFHDEADIEGPEWEGFLSAWVEIIGDTPKTCQEIAAIVRENSGFGSTLPDNLQDILKNPEKSFERTLGRALARKEKRPYGENSWALQRVGTDKRAVLWRVAPL